MISRSIDITKEHMYIINGIIGGCTDIVSAVIDSSDVELVLGGTYLNFTHDRELLNRSPMPSDIYADAKQLESKFKSIQSYLSKRHIEPTATSPEFKYIFVDASSDKAIDWVIDRSHYVIDKNVITTAMDIKNKSVIGRHVSDLVITLEDILEGRLIEKLTPFVDTPLDTELYSSWLLLIKDDFPF